MSKEEQKQREKDSIEAIDSIVGRIFIEARQRNRSDPMEAVGGIVIEINDRIASIMLKREGT